jgi:hypothetical protein
MKSANQIASSRAAVPERAKGHRALNKYKSAVGSILQYELSSNSELISCCVERAEKDIRPLIPQRKFRQLALRATFLITSAFIGEALRVLLAARPEVFGTLMPNLATEDTRSDFFKALAGMQFQKVGETLKCSKALCPGDRLRVQPILDELHALGTGDAQRLLQKYELSNERKRRNSLQFSVSDDLVRDYIIDELAMHIFHFLGRGISRRGARLD